MNKSILETPSPEECSSTIFEISGTKFDPEIAADLWPKVLQHKWLLSEKVGRDVGLRTACIDFLENMDQAIKEYMDYKTESAFVEELFSARKLRQKTRGKDYEETCTKCFIISARGPDAESVLSPQTDRENFSA